MHICHEEITQLVALLPMARELVDYLKTVVVLSWRRLTRKGETR